MTRRIGGTKHRTRRSATQWRKLIEQFECSGQTRGKFCAANGLALRTFDQWRRKLHATPASAGEASPEALFVELTHPGQAPSVATATRTGAWEVELELGAGVVLRLRRVAPC